jgi:carbon-monoxide dehydrogenase iron sulfur subunit
MKRVVSNEDVCIGCRLCEVWCKVQHSKSKDIIKAFKKETPMARVHVEERGAQSFAVQCRHCEEPDCVYSCITGAMSIDEETGQVMHDPEKCVGCWTCIMVCHRGAILRDERLRRIASKCDLCPGLDIPACVAHCPNEALCLVEENQNNESL